MNENIKTLIKLFFSSLHGLLTFIIALPLLISTNETVILYSLLVMTIIKFSYYIFGRCILTYLEDGKIYPSSPQILGYIITKKKLNDADYEEISINGGILLLLSKLFLLLIIKYYYIYLPSNFKKLISKYLYNDYKL